MFDIGWSELMVIAVVTIVVIGPKDLPRALRTVGQWTSRMKRMAREFQTQFTEAIREAELDAVQRDIEGITKLDPMADVRAAAQKTEDDIKRDLNKVSAAVPREPYPWEVKSDPAATVAAVVPPPEPVSSPPQSETPATVEQKP